MSDVVPAAPAPAPAPAAIPAAPSAAVARYVRAFQDKERRMKESWNSAARVLAFIVVGAIGLYVAAYFGLTALFKSAFFLDLKTNYFALLEKTGLSYVVLQVIVPLVLPAIFSIAVIQACPGVLVWWERKVAAHMQGRLGPMDVGGWHGWAQTIADGIKLFLKEIIEPDGVDKWVFRAAPVVVFVPAYLSFAPLYYGTVSFGYDFDIGLIYVMAISGLSTIGVLMAGWGSANKFSIFGGLRAAAQVVSFEIPRVMSVIPVVMWAGTTSLVGIGATQAGYLGGWFPKWFIFYPIVGQISFIIYLITTIAETNRVPFDVPEAESELVAGFHTEYGGMKFAIFFMAEYAYVFVGSVLGTILFLGGGSPLFPGLGFIPGWIWFLGKTFALIFIFLWARWTLPRLRTDRVMDLCWKIFLPWTLINIVIAGAAILWRVS